MRTTALLILLAGCAAKPPPPQPHEPPPPGPSHPILRVVDHPHGPPPPPGREIVVHADGRFVVHGPGEHEGHLDHVEMDRLVQHLDKAQFHVAPDHCEAMPAHAFEVHDLRPGHDRHAHWAQPCGGHPDASVAELLHVTYELAKVPPPPR